MGWTIDEEHLQAATRAVSQHALRTPLIPAPRVHRRAWLKLETSQHTGSFKVRGALAKMAGLTEAERACSVVAASAGNHGLGIAYAGRVLGIGVRVFVPVGAPWVKRSGMAALGADIIVTDAKGYDETEALAREEAERSSAVFISPFDDPVVAAGNGGTIGLEILEAMACIDAIVAPVGGGGLVAGLSAAREVSGTAVRLIGVQSEASPAMHRSLEEGRAIETFEGQPTLAEGLEGGVCQSTFDIVQSAVERVDLVGEEAIAAAMARAKDTLGLVVEGSAATTLAWAADYLDSLSGTGPVVLVVTGGNVDVS